MNNPTNKMVGRLLRSSYDSKERFASYWHQIDETLSLSPKKMLEIGVGNGFVAGYLERKGIDVITFDIVKELNPKVVGNILNLCFKGGAFDLVACYQVLEHLPYKKFSYALSEIRKVTNKYVILSLPDVRRKIHIDIKLNKFIKFKKIISIAGIMERNAPAFTRHYWEIGVKDYPLHMVSKDIQASGFEIIKMYNVFEHPYHMFFVLKKV